MKKSDITINTGGGPAFLDKVDNKGGTIQGRSDHNQNGMSADVAAKLFASLFAIVDRHPGLSDQEKTDVKSDIGEIRHELSKKQDKPDEGFLMRRLRNIGRMAPDILEVTLATIANPAAGFGVAAAKIAQKARESAG